MLVTGDTSNGNRRVACRSVSLNAFQQGFVELAKITAAVANIRQHGSGHPKQRQQLIVPVTAGEVVQIRAASVGGVRQMGFAAGKVPDQPAVDGTERQFAVFRARTSAVHMVQNPGDFGGREIWVEQQPRTLLKPVSGHLFSQLFALRSGTAVLPDDGVVNRFSGGFIPYQRGFPLVGDAQRLNVQLLFVRLLKAVSDDR